MWKEFKEFAIKGNVVDMAVGIVIGGAFGTIVKSLVEDIVMPPIGLLIGGLPFKDLKWTLRAGSPASINYGAFVNNVLSFLIVAFTVFILIKALQNLKRGPAAPIPEPTVKPCPQCLMDIPVKATRCGHCTSEVRPA